MGAIPYRVGIVDAQNLATGRVRVTFLGRDHLQSWWLPVLAPKTQSDKAYWMPDLGEQVVCLMDEHDEDGCVLGAIYSTVDTPPVSSADKFHASFKDGAAFEYDRAAHALSISLPAGATMSVAAPGGTVSINAATITLAGGGPAVARVGDTVEVNDPDDNIIYGKITSGSAKVNAG